MIKVKITPTCGHTYAKFVKDIKEAKITQKEYSQQKCLLCR